MKKIAHQFTLGLVVLTLLSVGTLWLYQILFLEQTIKEQSEKSLIHQVDIAVENFDSLNNSAWVAFLEALYDNHQIVVDVATLDGRMVMGSMDMSGRGAGMPHRVFRGDTLNQLRALGGLVLETTHNRTQMDMLTYARVFNDDQWIISGSVSLAPIESTIQALERQLVLLTGFMLLLASVIGFFMSRLVLRPIKALNASVTDLAHGKMDTRVRIRENNEFKTLGENFNAMADALDQVDRLQKELIANISHELRTPLSIIKGYAELTRDVHGNDLAKREAHLNLIIHETDRLAQLVQEALSLTQLQTGQVTYEFIPFEVNGWMQTLYDKYQFISEQHSIHLELKILEQSVWMMGDPYRLEQVIQNFVINALAHTKEGKTITLKVTEAQEKVRVSVCDQGSGIHPDGIPNIFERYYQTDHHREDGFGLGLAIAKQILEAHGFHYGVNSSIGMGSTFFFEGGRYA